MHSLLILIPFLCIILLNLPFKDAMRKAAFPIASAYALFQVFLVAVQPAWFWGGNLASMGHLFHFKTYVDVISLVMFFCIALVGLISLLVVRNTVNKEQQRFNFINLLLLAFIGMNATVMAADLFSLYLFIEITAVASYILIALQKEKLALEGAFKYFILSAVATVMMLSAIGLMLFFAGNTSFAAIKEALNLSGNAFMLKLAIGLFICGLFIKSGVVPFHGWLPDAYCAAPTGVSVLLAGIVTKVSGVYVLIRLSTVLFAKMPPVQNALMFLGTVSIIVGALAALGQRDFKRMLAYSSISQVGYIILAAGCATPLAIIGAVFHLFNHAMFKSLLFVNAAALETTVGSVDMDKMGGLGAKMPVTGATSVIGLLSTAGIPPLSGFWSKLIIIIALWRSGNFNYAMTALLASILTLAYFLSMQRRVFFGKLEPGLENVSEAASGLVFAQVILAAITVVVGLVFPFVIIWR